MVTQTVKSLVQVFYMMKFKRPEEAREDCIANSKVDKV